jgi:2-polyprenyl-3-methyl-5-hydroxy-6-metoxy-1,4-benzoquinol methylase
MLEWTGERFLPWMNDPSLAYEHLHRYAYAAKLVEGKRVLDLASGEGYGSNLLAQHASAVIGVDIDPNAVAHACERYGNRGANVQFIAGSITSVPIADDHSFDAIVCFEAIEHMEDQHGVLREVRRLLKRDGLFIVSTPNKVVYQDSREESPFHQKELTFEEFKTLLAEYFVHMQLLGQHIHAQSNIWPIGSATGSSNQDFTIEREGEEFAFVSNDKRTPLYLIALASDSPLHLTGSASVLVDESNLLLKEKDRTIRELLAGKTALENGLQWRENQLSEDLKTYQAAETALLWKDNQIRELTDGNEWLKTRLSDFEEKMESRDKALKWREEQVATYQMMLEKASRQIDQQLDQLRAIHSSWVWRFILRFRRLQETFTGLLRFRS